MRRTTLLPLGIVLVAACGALAGLALRGRLPAAERGRRLAERTGCFTCHGPGGLRGVANPGRTDKTVPNFEADVMMYARTPEEVRQWIRKGVTAKKSASTTWRADRNRGALRMPAFEHRLNARQIDDLVAFVQASAGRPEPDDPLAAHGLARADSLGCFGCHGPGGRLAPRNPGSLKGYVPSWDGEDFAELVRDRGEFEQWVRHGVSRRFEHDRLARFFLDRAVLRMPAFQRHLAPGDVDALWAYVVWLRTQPAPPTPEHPRKD